MVKSASLVRTGLTDEIIGELDDYQSSSLPAAWKAALAFADHLAGKPKGPIPGRLHEELGEQEAEITVDDSGSAKAGFTFKAKKKE